MENSHKTSLSESLRRLTTTASSYFDKAQEIVVDAGLVIPARLWQYSDDVDKHYFWSAMPQELQQQSDDCIAELIRLANQVGTGLKTSFLATDADRNDLSIITKGMRAALKLRAFRHWDADVLHNEGEILGIQHSGQSDDDPLVPLKAKAAFIKDSERFAELIQLVEANNAVPAIVSNTHIPAPVLTEPVPRVVNAKPRVFVASSVEQLDLANAVQSHLDYDAEVTVWNQDVFLASQYPLESMVEQLDKSDFGIFVLAADDVRVMRGNQSMTARDNVIFELGIFMGRLGRDRCFFIVPRNSENLELPSDLKGLTPLNYDANRSDKNISAALGPACQSIRAQLKKSKAKHRPRRESFQIVKALWGANDTWNDVTDLVTTRLKIGDPDVRATTRDLGDPLPYLRKQLLLVYTFLNEDHFKLVPEDEVIRLPAP